MEIRCSSAWNFVMVHGILLDDDHGSPCRDSAHQSARAADDAQPSFGRCPEVEAMYRAQVARMPHGELVVLRGSMFDAPDAFFTNLDRFLAE